MKKALFILVIILLFVAGYFLTKSPTPPHKSQTVTANLTVKDRKLVSGPEVIHAFQGDTVVIHITADEDEELHLHGYDKAVDLEKNKQATLKLIVDKSGRFPYELEHSKTDIGALEVSPR